MKDLYNNISAVSVLHSVVVSATANHADIDLAGYNSAVLLIDLGTDAGTGLGESHNLAFKLEHADDDGTGAAGSYAAVATADIQGYTPTAGVFLTVDSTDEDNTLYKVGYVGGKRFLKLTYTEAGTVSVPMTIIILKGHPIDAPVS